MMTSSNESGLRVAGTLWGEPPVTGGFPSQRPSDAGFDVSWDGIPKKRLNKQTSRRWLETPVAHSDEVAVLSFFVNDYIQSRFVHLKGHCCAAVYVHNNSPPHAQPGQCPHSHCPTHLPKVTWPLRNTVIWPWDRRPLTLTYWQALSIYFK